jgi:hypothetical protein
MEDLIEEWVTDLPETIPYLLRLIILGVPADPIEQEALDHSITTLVDKIAVCFSSATQCLLSLQTCDH